MKFKDRPIDEDEVCFSDDPYYDLFHGGYIKPQFHLENEEDIKKVKEAVETIREFLEGAVSNGNIILC